MGVFHPPPRGFWLINSEVESFFTRNFVTFPNIKCRIRTKYKKFRILHLGSRDMTIFGEWASYVRELSFFSSRGGVVETG